MPAVTFTLNTLPAGGETKILRFEPRDAPWTFGGTIVTPDGFQRSYTRGTEHTEDLPIGAWRIRIGTQWYSFDVGDDGGDLATLIAWGIPAGTPASTLTAAIEAFGQAWLASFTDTTLAEKVSATGTVRTAVDDRIRTVGDANYVPAFPDVLLDYDEDDQVISVIENGIETTYTYNGDGTVATDTRGEVTRTYTYSDGNLVSIETEA